MQRLANSSPSDRLAKALTMLGRVVKSIYILKYLNEEDLRHRVQLKLNRGEHRHSLARWIFFANQGEFRTGDYQEIMNKASSLSLVSNAILVWTTARIVETLRQTGTPIADEDLAHVSPRPTGFSSATKRMGPLNSQWTWQRRRIMPDAGWRRTNERK
jgi:TnpA family transposase